MMTDLEDSFRSAIIHCEENAEMGVLIKVPFLG